MNCLFFRRCRGLMVGLLIIFAFGFVTEENAQSKLTLGEFSRLSLQTRASFFEREILKAAREEGVDPNILWTIAYNETRFRPWLRSPKNAKGLMQFIPATAARFDLKDPYQPIPAIKAAARYVKYLSSLFNGRIDSILAAYNSGEGTVSAYLHGRKFSTKNKIINPRSINTIGGVPPYRETLGYVGRGLKIYRWLISIRKYPASTVRAIYPTVISSAVARVSFFDTEIGDMPAIYKNLRQEIPANPTSSAGLVNEKSEPSETSESNKDRVVEVYYDPRSGSRYRVENGTRIKLSESGILVINSNTPGEKTNLARATFFAVSSNK